MSNTAGRNINSVQIYLTGDLIGVDINSPPDTI